MVQMDGTDRHAVKNCYRVTPPKSRIRELGGHAVRDKRKIVYLAFVSAIGVVGAGREEIDRTTREMSKSAYVAFVAELRMG